MRYSGGKFRIAKDLLPVILEHRQMDEWYVEPFCGSMNVISQVTGKRIANDIDKELIGLYRQTIDGLFCPPDRLSFEEFQDLKKMPSTPLKTFATFGCSYGGTYDGGYARCSKGINYCGQSKRSLLKKAATLKHVILTAVSYQELEIPPNSIIYCDPPYKGSTHPYRYQGDFNHDDFWEWCRVKSKEGHTLYVSERSAPEDFKCVWQKTIKNSFTYTEQTEKLFKFDK